MGARREEIEEIMHRSGLTEEEARARYHLGEAFKAFREVGDTPAALGVEPMGPFTWLATIAPHFEALQNVLARRVLERERPEGWGRGGAVDEEQEEGG